MLGVFHQLTAFFRSLALEQVLPEEVVDRLFINQGRKYATHGYSHKTRPGASQYVSRGVCQPSITSIDANCVQDVAHMSPSARAMILVIDELTSATRLQSS